MSHKKAREVILRAQVKLRKHYSGNPEHELEDEKIKKLYEDIELAKEHLTDEE